MFSRLAFVARRQVTIAAPRVSLNVARSSVVPQFTRFNNIKFYSTIPKQDVEKRIVDVVKNFDKISSSESTVISPETSFVTDLGLDSLDTVEVLVAIEEEFDIEIDDKDADEIKTVGQAIEYISNHPDAI